MAASIQRDKERETFRRGMQYRRAIQLYYRKFNRYPPNLDALVKTNEIRFLRKKYLDPMTGKDDWKPIMFGQNKTPLAMGFFGQPLAGFGTGGTVLAGTGPDGGNGIAGASSIGGGIGSSPTGSAFGSSNSFGSNSAFGGSNSGISPTNTGVAQNGAAGGTGSTDASGSATDANGNPTTDPGTGAQPIGGQVFGGGAIIGVSPASPKQSIYVYKKMNHYNQWEFLYSPLSDQMNAGMTGPTQPSTPGVGAPGVPMSPAGGLGTTPTPSPTPTPDQPQQ